MNRIPFHFRGVPEFVDSEAERSGRPELAGAAQRAPELSALANLCAQAVEAGADRDRAAAILRQAVDFRDRLRIAADAAEAMVSAVAIACGCGPDADRNAAVPPEHGPRHAGSTGRGNPRRRRPTQGPGAINEL